MVAELVPTDVDVPDPTAIDGIDGIDGIDIDELVAFTRAGSARHRAGTAPTPKAPPPIKAAAPPPIKAAAPVVKVTKKVVQKVGQKVGTPLATAILTSATTAMGLVTALAWNDAFKSMFAEKGIFGKIGKKGVWVRAIVTSVIGLLLTQWLLRTLREKIVGSAPAPAPSKSSK